MAKKITRGITGIKDINKQDFDTNNVNDLLSDGQYNYIHRKKGKSEEYHNLTDNIKTISSDNTDLLTVTNNNKTNNTATLHPKHDAQKEQVLESERATITIQHGTNATPEKTKVDTNPQKVLEHSNLVSGSEYVTIEHEGQSEISKIKTDKLKNDMDDLNNKIAYIGGRNLLTKTNQGKTNWEWAFSSGVATAEDYNVDGVNAVKLTNTSDDSASWSFIKYQGLMRNLIKPNTKYILSFDVKPSVDVTFSAALKRGDGGALLTNASNMNKAIANRWTKVSCVLTSVATLPEDTGQVVYIQGMPTDQGNWLIIKNVKLEQGVIPSDWSPAPEDVNDLLAQKQNTLTSNASIGVVGTGLRQLYMSKYNFSATGALLKTHIKSISANTTVEVAEEEFNFIVKFNKNVNNATFTINTSTASKFSNIITTYGSDNGVTINGCLFTLNDRTLTVTRSLNTEQNYVITFSDII